MMWFHRRADFVVAWKVHDHRAGYDVVFLKLKTDSERPTWFAMHVDESAGMKGSRTVVGIANLVQLVVRDGNGCFYRQDSTEEAIRWLAAASIDPIDLAELREGWKSFELFDPNPRCPRWRRLAELPDADAWSGQQIWIDLLRRAIWVDSPHVPAETQGVACQDHPGGGGTSVAAKFILSSDWMVTTCHDTWSRLSRDTRVDELQHKGPTVREVLYEGIVEFLVDELIECALPLSTFGERWLPPTHWRWKELPRRGRRKGGALVEDLLAEVHARWLMTPRPELGDQRPRDLLAQHRDFVDFDLWNRERQWELTGRPPVPLPPHLSRFNGPFFGTHEIVIYFNMVRDLLRHAAAALMVGGPAIRSGLIANLHRHREVWLATPSEPESPLETPKYLINLERSRTPWAASEKSIAYDCECPLCQMMSQSKGITFGHFDTSGLDYEWPFSPMDDKADWEFANDDEESWSNAFHPAPGREGAAVGDPGPVPGTPESLDLRPLPPPSADMLGIWPMPVVMLHLACELRSLFRELEGSHDAEPMVRELRDGFTQLHDCVLDPGWVEVNGIIARMFAALSESERVAGEIQPVFTIATALDVLHNRLTASAEDQLTAEEQSEDSVDSLPATIQETDSEAPCDDEPREQAAVPSLPQGNEGPSPEGSSPPTRSSLPPR